MNYITILVLLFGVIADALISGKLSAVCLRQAPAQFRPKSLAASVTHSPTHLFEVQTSALPNWPSLQLADGLDADTLGALGDLQELNDALDGAIDAANPNSAGDILQTLVASPAIIAVPIGAGLLVAFAIGYFIFSYGQGRED